MKPLPDPEADECDDRGAVPLLWNLVRSRWRTILLGVLFACAATIAQAMMPAAIGAAIDRGMVARNQDALLFWGGAVLALSIAQAAASIMQDRTALSCALGASYQVIQSVTRAVGRSGTAVPDRVSAGELVSVSVSDLTSIGRSMEMIIRGAGAAVAVITVAAWLLTASWPLGVVVLVMVPVMVWTMTRLIRPLQSRQELLRQRQAVLADLALDIVAGLRVLRGIGGESVFLDRYRRESQRVRERGVHVAGVESAISGVKTLLPGLLAAVVVLLGGLYVQAGLLSAGELVAFYSYAVFLAIPLRHLTDAADQISRGLVAARRVADILIAARPLTVERQTSRLPLVGSLSDPETGLIVPPTGLVVVVCTSSAEAIAMAERVGGYQDSRAEYGSIPLREVPARSVRKQILVADNEAQIFSGQLRAEMSVGSSDDGALWRAVTAASASDLIKTLPEGLDSQVASGGREFSGGQRQRLRLVRALIADPGVLVLVEPTSAVDAHTEWSIARGVHQFRAGRSTVVFASSPAFVHEADLAVLVDKGRIVESGPPQKVLQNPLYRLMLDRGTTS